MRHKCVNQSSNAGAGRKHPEGDRDAEVVDGEPSDEASEPASDPEVGSPEDAFHCGGRWHRRVGLDEGEDGDQEEGRTKRFQSFQK